MKPLEVFMKCERCDGLMLEDYFIDMEALFEPIWSRVWRCLNCGHAVDPVMVANRQRHALLVPSHVLHEERVSETHHDVIDVIAAVAA